MKTDLKVNADESKGMVLGEEEGLKYEICVHGIIIRVQILKKKLPTLFL